MQVRCEHCGRDFKSPQGLAGHYAARHEAQDQEEAARRREIFRQAQKQREGLAEELARVQARVRAQEQALHQAGVLQENLTVRLTLATERAERTDAELGRAKAQVYSLTRELDQAQAQLQELARAPAQARAPASWVSMTQNPEAFKKYMDRVLQRVRESLGS